MKEKDLRMDEMIIEDRFVRGGDRNHKKKLLIVIDNQPDDKMAWSGTTFYSSKALEKVFDVSYLIHRSSANWFHKLLLFLWQKVDRVFHRRNVAYVPIWYRKAAYKKTSREIENAPVDYCLSSLVDVIAFCKRGMIHFTDSFLHCGMEENTYFSITKADLRLMRKVYQRMMDHNPLFIVPSDWAKKDVEKYYRVPKERVLMAPFGPNIPWREPPLKNKPIGKTVNVLFVGFDYRRKGLDKVKKVIQQCNVLDSEKRYLLHVAGCDGTNEENMIYYGPLKRTIDAERAMLEELFQKADLFMMLPKQEAAGIVFCEAAMYGLPAFSNDVGGIGTYVRDKINGRLFAIDEPEENMAVELVALAHNEAAYRCYADNQRKLSVELFNWNAWSLSVAAFLHQSII